MAGMPFLPRLLPRRRLRSSPRQTVPAIPPPLRAPRSALWWIVCVTVLVAVAVAATLWWLLADPAVSVPAPGLGAGGGSGAGSARGEMLRTALAAGAAVGAAVTLMLAFRRQHHQEVTAAHTTHDAVERRVTDLYTKAAEQLGHEAAAVRLAGLYALERLAQDNPGHRQTIVNVICAYLRMPWVSPGGAQQDLAPAVPRAAIAGVSVPFSGRDPHEELQVRLTAQRILEEHLRDDRTSDERTTEPADPRFWEGMRIDLTGTTITDLDFRNCHPAEAVFTGATFTGDAVFVRAAFAGDAVFIEATFTRDARFDKATLTKSAVFFDATAVPGDCHVWPDGWRLEVTSDGGGRLVRDSAADESGPVDDAPNEKA